MDKKRILEYVKQACFINDKDNQLRKFEDELNLRERKIIEECSHPLPIFFGIFKVNSIIDKEEYVNFCPFCLKELDIKDLCGSEIVDVSSSFSKVFEDYQKQENSFVKVMMKEKAKQILKSVLQPYIISLFHDLENVPDFEEVKQKILAFCQRQNFNQYNYLPYIEEVAIKRDEVVSLMKIKKTN